MPKKKKPYFHNNWKALKDAPAELFDSVPVDEFFNWKVAGWELPSSVHCIVREDNLVTGKVKEYIYQKPRAAQNKVRAIMDMGESEITVCHADAIHFLAPELIEDYDDPLA